MTWNVRSHPDHSKQRHVAPDPTQVIQNNDMKHPVPPRSFKATRWSALSHSGHSKQRHETPCPQKYKYRCIRVDGWFKNDKYIIWMRIWLMLKNISLLDRIWSLWFVPFPSSPPNFIFCLDRLKFSVSINSHPDNIYLSSFPPAISTYWLHKQKSYQSSRELSRVYQQSAGVELSPNSPNI